ncbi:MAG: immunoglobulin domain-containing protein, partial [Gaiellaceae bacterium]
MKFAQYYRGLALVLALLLSACGSGGDGDSVTPVTISAQPASASAVSGASATFTVAATGDGLAFQWQRSVDAGLTWATIVGAVTASYTIAAVDTSFDGYQFRVVVTGPNSSVTSSAVTLSVAAAIKPPAISVQPTDQSVAAGANASFSVTATGTSLAYLWQSSLDGTTWTNLSGATGATLTISAVAPNDSGKRFRAVVSNSAGSVNSSPALLTVAVA